MNGARPLPSSSLFLTALASFFLLAGCAAEPSEGPSTTSPPTTAPTVEQVRFDFDLQVVAVEVLDGNQHANVPVVSANCVSIVDSAQGHLLGLVAYANLTDAFTLQSSWELNAYLFGADAGNATYGLFPLKLSVDYTGRQAELANATNLGVYVVPAGVVGVAPLTHVHLTLFVRAEHPEAMFITGPPAAMGSCG